jgi:protocatechuate 3,4-dioxygenase, alpha subunit
MTEALGLTPSQTAGPYLSIGLLRDLVPSALVDSAAPGAIRIRGRLLDGAGDGVVDGMIEIWQASPAGAYGSDDFAGFGRAGTGEGGRFEFVTVKPGRVACPAGGLQAPHIAVGIFARGLLKRVVTRLYFPDEVEVNDADPVLSGLPPGRRESLVAIAEDGALRFDIRLQGSQETTFFAV